MENLTSKTERWAASGIQVCPECAAQRQQLNSSRYFSRVILNKYFLLNVIKFADTVFSSIKSHRCLRRN